MQQNRLFTMIAIGLVVALSLGLLGLGGWALIIRPRQQAAQAEMTGTPIAEAATPTSTLTPTLIPPASPTSTSTRVSTNTPVAPLATATSAPATLAPASPTVVKAPGTPALTVQPTKAPTTPTPAPTVPQTGFGPGLGIAAAAGLGALLFGARRLRKS